MTITLETQPRALNDLQILTHAAQQSRYIGLLTAADWQRYAAQECLCLLYDNDHLLGAGAWQIIGKEWCELGPYIVLPAHRGNGYGRLLIQATYERTVDLYHFAISKNPAMAYLLQEQGLHRASFAALPAVVRQHLRQRMTVQRIWHLLRKISLEPAQVLLEPT